MDLFLLGHTYINKNYTRPYKLSRVRPDRAVLQREREPYQEWQWPPVSRLLPQALCLLPQGLPETLMLYPQNQGHCALPGVYAGQQKAEGKFHQHLAKTPVCPNCLVLCGPQSPSASSRLSYSPGLLHGAALPVPQCWEMQKEGPASRRNTLSKAHEQGTNFQSPVLLAFLV